MTSKVQRGAPLQKGQREALANYVAMHGELRARYETGLSRAALTRALAGLPILPGTAALVVRAARRGVAVSLPPDLLGAVLDCLADRIAARIGETRERDAYSSTELPPRMTRRRFENCARAAALQAPTRKARHGCARAWLGKRRDVASRPRWQRRARRPRTSTACCAASGLRVVGDEPMTRSATRKRVLRARPSHGPQEIPCAVRGSATSCAPSAIATGRGASCCGQLPRARRRPRRVAREGNPRGHGGRADVRRRRDRARRGRARAALRCRRSRRRACRSIAGSKRSCGPRGRARLRAPHDVTARAHAALTAVGTALHSVGLCASASMPMAARRPSRAPKPRPCLPRWATSAPLGTLLGFLFPVVTRSSSLP